MKTGKVIQPVRRSKMHTHVLALAKKLYPSFRIENETRVDTLEGKLPVDIIIRELQVCIECQGIQHFVFNPHFHRGPEDLAAQQNRDELKKQEIRRAGWSYLAIRYDEYEKLTATALAKKITKAIKEK